MLSRCIIFGRVTTRRVVTKLPRRSVVKSEHQAPKLSQVALRSFSSSVRPWSNDSELKKEPIVSNPSSGAAQSNRWHKKTKHDSKTSSGKLANAMREKIEAKNAQGAFQLWQSADKDLQTSLDVGSRALQAMRILKKDKLAETLSDSLLERIRAQPPIKEAFSGAYNRAALFRSMGFAYNVVKAYDKLQMLISVVSSISFPVAPLCYTLLQMQLEADPRQPFDKFLKLIATHPEMKRQDDIISLLLGFCQRTLDSGSMTQLLEYLHAENVVLGPLSVPMVLMASAKKLIALEWAEKLLPQLLEDPPAILSDRLVSAVATIQTYCNYGAENLAFDLYEKLKRQPHSIRFDVRKDPDDKIVTTVALLKLCARRELFERAFQIYAESRRYEPSGNVAISALLSPFNYSRPGNALFDLVAQHIRGEMQVPGTNPSILLPQLNMTLLEPASLRFLLHAMIHSDHPVEAAFVLRAGRADIGSWRLRSKNTIELIRYLSYHMKALKDPNQEELIKELENFAASLLVYNDSTRTSISPSEHQTFASLAERSLDAIIRSAKSS